MLRKSFCYLTFFLCADTMHGTFYAFQIPNPIKVYLYIFCTRDLLFNICMKHRFRLHLFFMGIIIADIFITFAVDAVEKSNIPFIIQYYMKQVIMENLTVFSCCEERHPRTCAIRPLIQH